MYRIRLAVLGISAMGLLALVWLKYGMDNEPLKAKTFNQLLAGIERLGWNKDLSEAYDAGPEAPCIIILADVHDDAVEKVNSKRVLVLEEMWDLETIFLENVCGALFGDENVKMRQAAARTAFSPPEWEALRKTDPLMHYSPNYTALNDAKGFTCYGIEDSKYFVEIAPCQQCSETYEFLEEALTALGTELIPLNQPNFDIFFRAQPLLNNFPQLERTRLKAAGHISSADRAYLDALIGEYYAWTDQHLVLARNKIAVRNALARIKSTGQKKAAMIIGLGHVDPSLEPSVQTLLRNAHVSYIILYPNDPSLQIKFAVQRN